MRIFRRLQDGLLPQAQSIRANEGHALAFAHYAEALILRVLDRFEEAVQLLQRARQLQPDVPDTLLELVLCLGRLGRDAEALPIARDAVLLQPGSPAALGNLAMCLLLVGEKNEARQVLDLALEQDPSDELNVYMDAHFDQYKKT
jgi:Flp pilus assembly protein TadD